MAGLIPQPFLDELLQRIDIVELIDSYVPLKKQGTSYAARCPFHSEKTPSFNVVPNKQFYHCFGCGASGNAISFVMEHLSQGFVDAVETLASRVGMEVPRSEQEKQHIQFSKNHYELLDKVCQFYQKSLRTQGELAVDYLKSRGLSGVIAQKYQLGFAPPGWHTIDKQFAKERKGLISTGVLIERDDGSTYDRYRNRIMFPIHDKRGRIIGFGGRVIDSNDHPKYLNSPETAIFQKNRELYGLYQALEQGKELASIIIVEGYMDVIALAQNGIPNAVATLGTATSTTHIQLLARHSKRIVFCFDGDNAGRQAAHRAMNNCFSQLSQGLDIGFAFLPQGHDPDSLVREEGQEQFNRRMANAIPLVQFFFQSLQKEADLSTLAGRSLLANKAKPFLNQIPDDAYRELMLEELARFTRIDREKLSSILKEEEQDTPPPAATKKLMPSNTRLAIALLIQNPHVYAEVAAKLNEKLLFKCEIDLLIQLIEQIKQHPDIKTGNLIELWRNSNYFLALSKLAAWQHHVPDEGISEELFGALKHIEKQAIEKEINALLNKANNPGLSDEERLQLQEMIKQRAKVGEQCKT